MTDYLTDYGKEIIRQLYYEVEVKKQELQDNNADLGGYDYQAIQQREIALDTLFRDLITVPAIDIKDEDTTNYYDYLAQSHKKTKFNTDLAGAKTTVRGIPKIMDLYKEELIATAAAWHDGIFLNLPDTTDIGEIEPCTVNYNFLERQQGFRIALRALDFTEQSIRLVEDEVRNSIYTLGLDPNGRNHYIELAHYDEDKQ